VLGAAGEALSFDGGDALALPPGFDDLRDGVTLVVVARPTAAGRWAPLLELADADGGRRIALQRKGTSDDARLTCGGASLVVPDALPVGEAAILTAVVGPDGQAQVRRGGIEVAAGVLAVPERALRTTNIVGGSLLDGTPGFEGELSELLLYDRELGQPELAALEADLADRHGLYHLDAAWIDGSGYSAGLVALIHAEQLTKAEADAWGTP
jgi:hypothetical protein